MDSINSVSSSHVASKGHNASKAQQANAEPNKEAMPDVNVELSEDIKAAESEALMRQAKVQEMRSAIEEGRFPLDAKKIAENFAELEKLL
jgi:flagellar biosynthesis anti-sigma factor FlgM